MDQEDIQNQIAECNEEDNLEPLEAMALYFIRHFLKRLYPYAFPKRPAKVPLAKGIVEQLINNRKEYNVRKVVIRKAIQMWCNHGINYYEGCAIVGAPRFNLDGTIAGYITKEEASYARKRINEYKKKIKKDKIENKVEIEKNGQLTLF